tara:strand:- start:3838 stop:5172 length:1335 start_codon:yes stop_codon:yes gene_type:complete
MKILRAKSLPTISLLTKSTSKSKKTKSLPNIKTKFSLSNKKTKSSPSTKTIKRAKSLSNIKTKSSVSSKTIKRAKSVPTTKKKKYESDNSYLPIPPCYRKDYLSTKNSTLEEFKKKSSIPPFSQPLPSVLDYSYLSLQNNKYFYEKYLLYYSYLSLQYNKYFYDKYLFKTHNDKEMRRDSLYSLVLLYNYLHYESIDLNSLKEYHIIYFVDFFKMYHSSYYIDSRFDNYKEYFDFVENIEKNLYKTETFNNFNNDKNTKNNFRKDILNIIKNEFMEFHKEYIKYLIKYYYRYKTSNKEHKLKIPNIKIPHNILQSLRLKYLNLFFDYSTINVFYEKFEKHLKIVELLLSNNIDLSLLDYLTYYKPYNFMNKIYEFYNSKYSDKNIDIDTFYKSIKLFYDILFSKELSKKKFFNKIRINRLLHKKFGIVSDNFNELNILFGGKKE